MKLNLVVLFVTCFGGLGVLTTAGPFPISEAPSEPTYEAPPELRETAERFLELSGGRDAWKDVRTVRVLAVNRTEGVPLPYLFEVSVDFRTPRTLTRLLNQDMDRLRGFLGDSGWGVKEAPEGYEAYSFPAERLPFERVLWEGAFSRNLWRVAIRDPELVLKEGAGGRLEFHNQGGGLTAWFEFDTAGYPIRFGFPGDDNGLELGPYASYGPRRIPVSGRTPDGVFFESLYLRVSSEPLQVPETPPSNLTSFNPR